jgi:polysaccharide pyruvyl transferase WcaK-like protein
MGVLALGISLSSHCDTAVDSARITFMVGNSNSRPVPCIINGEKRLVPIVNYRLSPRSRFSDHLFWIVLAAILYRVIPSENFRRRICRKTPWIAALEHADMAGDVRGGDSFSDIYGFSRFFEGFLVAWTVLLIKGRMVQFPQTFGPYKNPLARILARYLLKRSSVVIARDEKSRHVAQALIGKKPGVWLSPDVAFSLKAVRPKKVQLDPPLEGPVPAGTIGINVNGLMYNGGYTGKNMFGLKLAYRGFVSEMIEALLAEHQGELWLVSHTYAPAGSVESDPEACRKIREGLAEPLRQRVRIVTGVYDAHEIKGVIGQFDFFIGSRMHACIAALSQGVPCVGVAYSRKFEGVFDSVGMNGWVVDGRTTVNPQAIVRILELYRKRDLVRGNLAKNAEQAKVRLKEVFRRIFETIDHPDRSGQH